MIEQLAMVRAFHKKHGFPTDVPLSGLKMSPRARSLLRQLSSQVVKISQAMEPREGEVEDIALTRAHLCVEEPGEGMHALSEQDEVAVLDWLCDNLYVLLGTAATFGLDRALPAAFAEVHRSNMTKAKQDSDPARARLRDKGPGYSSPDLKAILERSRPQRFAYARARDGAHTYPVRTTSGDEVWMDYGAFDDWSKAGKPAITL